MKRIPWVMIKCAHLIIRPNTECVKAIICPSFRVLHTSNTKEPESNRLPVDMVLWFGFVYGKEPVDRQGLDIVQQI